MVNIINIPPVLLIALPLLFAFLAPLVYMISKKVIKYYTLSVLILNALLSYLLFFRVMNVGVIYEQLSGFYPPVGILLAMSYMGAILAMLINTLSTINYLSFFDDDTHPLRFSMLYMLVTASSTGIVITGDLFNMFVFFEITAVGSYGLLAARDTKRSYEGAIKYIVLGSIGSAFLLLGIATIYGYLKTLNFYDIAARINNMPETARLMSFLFLIIGIGVEAEIFPLNGWVPDAYQGASSRVASFMVLGPSKAGIYAIARLIFTLIPIMGGYELALILGALTLLIGELAALNQEDVKRMLAYSSIGQMGLILIALSMHSQMAFVAAIFLMVNHALAKALLFLSSRNYSAGILKNPVIGATIFIGALAIIGMPPFPGFWGKWYLVVDMAHAGLWFMILVILFSAIVEAVYYARFLFRGTGAQRVNVKKGEFIAMVSFAVILVILAIFPGWLYNPALNAASSLLGGGP